MKRRRTVSEEGSDNSADQPSAQSDLGGGGAGAQGPLPWVVNSEGRSRFFCPVSDCPHANVSQGGGWANLQGVRGHLREHYGGRFSGAVPQAFLEAHNLCSCSDCGKIISRRFNRTCPACHPSRRAATTNGPTETSATAALPSLDDVCTTRARLLK